jgi:hypothetical protein
VYRSLYPPHAFQQRFVDQPVAIPMHLFLLLTFEHFWQRYRFSYHLPQSIRLRKRLTIQLVDPLCRSVGRNHYERDLLIISLSYCRIKIEQCRTRSHTHYDRLITFSHRKSKSLEAGATFVGYRIASDVFTLVEIMNYGCISAARTHHSMANTMRYQ